MGPRTRRRTAGIEVGAELALLHRGARRADQEVEEITAGLDEVVARGTRPIVELGGGGDQRARWEPRVVDLIGHTTPTGAYCRARLKAGGPTRT